MHEHRKFWSILNELDGRIFELSKEHHIETPQRDLIETPWRVSILSVKDSTFKVFFLGFFPTSSLVKKQQRPAPSRCLKHAWFSCICWRIFFVLHRIKTNNFLFPIKWVFFISNSWFEIESLAMPEGSRTFAFTRINRDGIPVWTFSHARTCIAWVNFYRSSITRVIKYNFVTHGSSRLTRESFQSHACNTRSFR